MRVILRVFFVALFAFVSLYSPTVHADEHQNSSIMRSVFADGRLWLLTSSGQVSSLAETSKKRRIERPSGKVIDLCVAGGHATILTRASDNDKYWKLQRWTPKGWRPTARVRATWDGLIGIECRDKRITLVTATRLVEIENGKQRSVRISGVESGFGLVTLAGTQADLFIGVNSGEWGGALFRIDRKSGKVVPSSGNPTEDTNGCGGALSYACSPVTAIVELPWKPSCVGVARGLIHMGSADGNILDVCGDDAKVMHSEFLYPDDPKAPRDRNGNLYNKVPFFGLVKSEGRLMATSFEGVYSIDEGGTAKMLAQPQYMEIDGVNVSFYRSDIVLVLTTINQRNSVSGAVPLIVSR